MNQSSILIADNAPEICRGLFPALHNSVYLDTGSAGLSFIGQARAAAQFYEDKASGYLALETFQARAMSVRQKMAAWLKVQAGEIEFFSGTTDALNIVGYSVDWCAGDEVVVAEDEFPSVRLAWQAAERAGGRIKLVAIPSESEREAALIDALSANTRVLAVAHVHTLTGTKLDLDKLGAACRRRDCLLVVDGIHALGATPVGLENVDVYVSGVFKWLLAGFGLAVCVVRDRARNRMHPAFRGYRNQPPDNGMQFSHENYPGLYALEASLQLLGDTIGWETVYARTAALVDWLAQALRTGGLELAAPQGARAGIASFPVPDAKALRMLLAEKHMHAAAKGKYLRATPFFYNSRNDVERFAEEVLRHCG